MFLYNGGFIALFALTRQLYKLKAMLFALAGEMKACLEKY